MKTQSRIASILKTNCLDSSVTGLPTFDLAQLDLKKDLDFILPSNLRLGHLAEFIVSGLINASTNYEVIYENIQLIEDKQTIGELDFIIENSLSKSIIHMELAYKFYLFDPSLSNDQINNWIGPNRNDSLKQKLDKLKTRQFPLLQKPITNSTLNLETNEISQALCLLVNLYVPFEYKNSFSPAYAKAIKGYYINQETFINLESPTKSYYLPPKKEWGMDPMENKIWFGFHDIIENLNNSMEEKQAVLCWQKNKAVCAEFFIISW